MRVHVARATQRRRRAQTRIAETREESRSVTARRMMAALAGPLEVGLLSLNVGATFGLSDAAIALRGAVIGRVADATVLTSDS
jgi:hypothetical protein